jgi:hypothetical protein
MAAILSVIAAIALSLLGVGGFTTFALQGVANIKTAATASQLLTFDKAAQQYVTDNGTIIAATATATVPVTITAAMLSATNYLPASYLATNPFGQTWQVQVLQPSPGVLQSIVMSTGGAAITDTKQLVQIAAQAGAQGGFIPYANQAGDATMQPTNAYGAYGAWKVSLANYTNPGAGHVASLLAFGNTQANNSYLYRVAVPNHPELNNMQTDLGLTDTGGTAHNIYGANAVQASEFDLPSGAMFDSDGGGSLELGAGNDQPGTGVAYIDFHLGGQGVQDFNARIINDQNNHLTVASANGQATLGVQGTIQPGNVAAPGSACSGNSSIAGNADGSGQILSCQWGSWLPIGGRWLQMAKWDAWNGTILPQPACPSGGVPGILVSPAVININPTATLNTGATPGAGVWTVYVTDGNGSPVWVQTEATTYCAF